MTHYIAIIHKEPRSDFGVSFSDFPGCITAGSDLDEARRMAKEALEFHIEGMLEDGETIPAASSFEAIRAAGMEGDLYFEVAVTPPISEKALRVNITLPETLLREIDHYTHLHGLTRSRFLAAAAKQAFREFNG